MSQADEEPRLEAWIDDDTFHVRVEYDGTVYEDQAADLETLLQTEQFLPAFQRPALTLLSVWERAAAEEAATDLDDDVPEDVSTAEVS